MISRRLPLLTFAVCIAAVSARAEESRRFTVVVSAGLDGQLGAPQCPSGTFGGRTLAHLAASVAKANAAATADGRSVLATIQLGDFVGPGALTRFLLTLPDGAEKFGDLIGRSGFDYSLPGKHWIGQPADDLKRIAKALPSEMHLMSANLRCKDRPDCDAINSLPPRAVLNIGDVPIALFAADGDGVLEAVDPAIAKGLTIEPIAATVRTGTASARAAGAQLVIAVFNFDNARASMADVARVIAGIQGLDLVIVNQVGQFRSSTTVVSDGSGPPVVVAGQTSTDAVRIDFSAEEDGSKWNLGDIATSRVIAHDPDRSLTASLSALAKDYCAAWNQPLPVVADPAVDRPAFLRQLLESMRVAAGTDIAAVNDALAAPDAFPMKGPMSTADVFAALRYADTIASASVTGAWIQVLYAADTARRADGKAGLIWAGVEKRGDDLWVNGRELDEESHYSIAVADFLARGGDGWIIEDPGFQVVRNQTGAPTSRDLMMRALTKAPPGTGFLKLEHPDLSKRFRWTWTASLTLSTEAINGQNQTVYEDSRLLMPTSLVFGGDLWTDLDGEEQDHNIRFSLRARYFMQTLNNVLTKLDDEAFGEALYMLRTPRHLLGDRLFAPIPYVGASIDTEFTPTVDEAYRQMELGGAIGARFVDLHPFELKIAFGVRREMLDPTAQNRAGLVLGYDLPKKVTLHLAKAAIELESSFDYFVSPAETNTFQEGRFRFRLNVPVIGPLALTAGLDLFFYRLDPGPWALLAHTTAGLTLREDGAVQQF